jgi:hypothetical protein
MADRKDYYFRQKVTEAELDGGFDDLEEADQNILLGLGLIGVTQNAVVTQHAGTPDLTVDVSGSSVVLDKDGQRIAWGPVQTVDVSVDESSVSTAVTTPSNEKIVSVFAKFTRNLSDPRVDGNSLTVYFERAEDFEFIIRQGSESAAPATPTSTDPEYILLADIRRSYGQTQILNTDITPPGGSYTGITNRREDAFVVTVGSTTLRAGTPEEIAQELFTELADSANLAFDGSGATWKDASGLAATNVEDAIKEILTDLSGADAASGSYKVSFRAAQSTWKDASGLVATDVQAAIDEILTDLSGADAASGSYKVSFRASQSTWKDASGLTSTSVQAAIDEILTDLSGADAASGSYKVSFRAAQSTWADASGLSATNIQAAIDEILTDLAGTSGPSRIGAPTLTATWENGDSINPFPDTVRDLFETIVEHLAEKTSAAACGADRVGVYGAGSSIAFSTGSIQEALTTLGDNAGKLSGTQTWTGSNTFSTTTAFNASGDSISLGNVAGDISFSNTVGSGGENSIGIVDATSSTLGRDLRLFAQRSYVGKGGGLVLEPGKESAAGYEAGSLVMDFDDVDGTAERRVYEFSISLDSNSTTGGYNIWEWNNSKMPANSVVLLELEVLGLGAGSDDYIHYRQRCIVRKLSTDSTFNPWVQTAEYNNIGGFGAGAPTVNIAVSGGSGGYVRLIVNTNAAENVYAVGFIRVTTFTQPATADIVGS